MPLSLYLSRAKIKQFVLKSFNYICVVFISLVISNFNDVFIMKVLINLARFPKGPNVPSILNWTFQMILKSAVGSTNSNTRRDIHRHYILILMEEMKEISIQKFTAEVIQAKLRKY